MKGRWGLKSMSSPKQRPAPTGQATIRQMIYRFRARRRRPETNISWNKLRESCMKRSWKSRNRRTRGTSRLPPRKTSDIKTSRRRRIQWEGKSWKRRTEPQCQLMPLIRTSPMIWALLKSSRSTLTSSWKKCCRRASPTWRSSRSLFGKRSRTTVASTCPNKTI